MGRRVEIPEYTSQWLAGDCFGEVVGTQTRMQFIRGRVDAATGRIEEDEVVWVTELARVKLEGSGEVVELLLADCHRIRRGGPESPAARKFKPRYAPATRSDDWVREQYEEDITDMMFFCSDEIRKRLAASAARTAPGARKTSTLEKICRERNPFEKCEPRAFCHEREQ